jgi:hypothetical protein
MRGGGGRGGRVFGVGRLGGMRMRMIGIKGIEVERRRGIGGDIVYLILDMTYLDDMIDTRYRDTNQRNNRPAIIRSLIHTQDSRPSQRENEFKSNTRQRRPLKHCIIIELQTNINESTKKAEGLRDHEHRSQLDGKSKGKKSNTGKKHLTKNNEKAQAQVKTLNPPKVTTNAAKPQDQRERQIEKGKKRRKRKNKVLYTKQKQ